MTGRRDSPSEDIAPHADGASEDGRDVPPEPPASAGTPAHARRRRSGDVDMDRGVTVIRDFARSLPGGPGCYRMFDSRGEVLYVGKARNLKRRVLQYAQIARQPRRLQRMVSETASMEVTQTHTEVEALLLESNLIKSLRPPFNILLRDDKSFPHILLTGDHAFARVVKHRGARTAPGDYFGPFASAGAVNRTITALQRAFLLRNCSDTVFAQRTRPCLQYQIKRCTAPCVGYVDEAQYAEQVAQAKDFLSGRSSEIQARFAERMQAASEALEFETAARYRDRIRALSAIQAHQDINVEGLEDADAIAAAMDGGQVCIQVYFFRGGGNYGNRAYFPSHDRSQGIEEVLGAFLAQFYANREPPSLLLVSHDPTDRTLLTEALTSRIGRKVQITRPQRGDKRRLIDHASVNAREALGRRLAESRSQRALLEGLADRLGLETVPERVEVFDNSHISGQDATGAMIVVGPDGFTKSAYRKFTIRDVEAAGDDYGMMREVLNRRFGRALREDPDRVDWPDLVLLDGGQGQLSVGRAVFDDLGITELPIAAVAKGPERNAGRERIFLPDRDPIELDPRDPVLYFIQRIRDEAHRFAIGTHRQRRQKSLERSALDGVPGIGAKRKKALLHHFGSARAVERAGLTDLAVVPGISEAVAKKIYDHFHGDS